MMKVHLRRAALAALILAAAPLPLAAGDFTIEAEAVKLENAKGKVVFCLWKEGQADAFPRCDKGKPLAILSADASAPKVAFKGLTPGAYAISMFHDEKGAGVLEYNIVGMPKSAIGLSNHRPHVAAKLRKGALHCARSGQDQHRGEKAVLTESKTEGHASFSYPSGPCTTTR